MKICSLYGAGFYYIPGTDTCIKIGGFVRFEENWNANGSFALRANGATATFNRTNSDLVNRARGIITTDVRSQTEYGTLRSYTAFGQQWTTGDSTTAGSGATTNMYRLFIQIGGFTAGRAESFFDFWSTPKYSNLTNFIVSDNGGTGDNVLAYTAQFGNGLSGTVSIEDPTMRRSGIVNSGVAGQFNNDGTTDGSYAGAGMPDVVANLRIDQAWGSAQIMGALHQVTANYYGTVEGSGHPDDQMGWAVGAGVNLNLPWAKGDTFTVQAAWTKGAIAYAGQGMAGGSAKGSGIGVYDGNDIALGYATDGVYGTAAANPDIELTTAWSVFAGIQHYWQPNVRTSLYGGYLGVSYNDTATAITCTAVSANVAGCGSGDADWGLWQIGSRTVWNPVKNLDLSVDVVYNAYQTASLGGRVTAGGVGDKPAGTYATSDQGVWQAMFRVQRNFYP